MVVTALAGLTVLGLLLSLVMLAAQWRQQAAPPPPAPARWPPVSILKPLKGVDADLERNLETFFHLDYPAYELIFGVADPADPALAVARRVAGRHPAVAARFATGGPGVGFNPKVNNLAGILPHARHELLLISDSNVAVAPAMLSEMVRRLESGDVGLVTSFIRGVGGRGLGGALESFQLNTFVLGGVAAVSGVLGRVCAVGKSMLLRRAELERIGGLAELGRYLAEDQVCGELIRALGREVVVCPEPIDNVLGHVSLQGFVGRHLRWARIRRHIAPAGYLGEALANPLPFALALLVAAPGAASAGLLLGTLGLLSALAAIGERALGVSRPLAHYPLLVVLRGLAVFLLWPLPFVGSRVRWRGRSFRIGRRTRLIPDQPWAAGGLVELSPEEAAA
jgi:ceramide glucosyltransferase